MDDDGPCAVPQPDAIQDPIAEPLAVFGYTLVLASLLLMLFDAKRRENWRYGRHCIITYLQSLLLKFNSNTF